MDYAACTGDPDMAYYASLNSIWSPFEVASYAQGDAYSNLPRIPTGTRSTAVQLRRRLLPRERNEGLRHHRRTGLHVLGGRKVPQSQRILHGHELGDDQNEMLGWDNDNHRTAQVYSGISPPLEAYPPAQDTPGDANDVIFGSAHFVGFNMALCDGSVHMMNYSIDPETHRRLGVRNDGLMIDPRVVTPISTVAFLHQASNNGGSNRRVHETHHNARPVN